MNDDKAGAIALLRALGAGAIRHPGGTLLEHLLRVHSRLETWGARPALRLAGLCHAFYGTDGFAVALGRTDRRGELSDVIGTEAEDIVYRYASCDRARTYPALLRPDGDFTDRFTGATAPASLRQRRDFAELTAANELDILTEADYLDGAQAAALLDLLASWSPLLSPAARGAVEAAARGVRIR